MITFLIVLGCILGHLVIGAVYARSQSVRLYQKAKSEWGSDRSARESLHMMMTWRVAFWPYAMVFDLFASPFSTWMTAPLAEREARVEQLRKDADHWKHEARYEVDGEKKAAYEELARVLREQAEELKL